MNCGFKRQSVLHWLAQTSVFELYLFGVGESCGRRGYSAYVEDQRKYICTGCVLYPNPVKLRSTTLTSVYSTGQAITKGCRRGEGKCTVTGGIESMEYGGRWELLLYIHK